MVFWRAAGVTYDASGNLTDVVVGPNAIHAVYDGENRLFSTSSTIAGASTGYRYDGDGRRIQKQVSGGATTTYVYDVQGETEETERNERETGETEDSLN